MYMVNGANRRSKINGKQKRGALPPPSAIARHFGLALCEFLVD
jgi:hypothetical protein